VPFGFGDGSLTPEQLAAIARIPPSGGIVTAFLSDQIDFAAVADYPFGGNWTTLPGYKFFIFFQSRWIYTNLNATTFLTGPTWSLGNNATFDNMIPLVANPTAAALNAFAPTGVGGPYSSAGATNGIAKNPDLTVVPTIRVSTAVTGTAVTQCKARMLINGFLTNIIPTI